MQTAKDSTGPLRHARKRHNQVHVSLCPRESGFGHRLWREMMEGKKPSLEDKDLLNL